MDSESDDCCCPSILKSEPVKSNGLSKLMAATSDQSDLTSGQRTNPMAGMKNPSANKGSQSRD